MISELLERIRIGVPEPVKRAGRRLRFYERIRISYFRLLHQLNGPLVNVRFSDAHCQFLAHSLTEYIRVRTLMGESDVLRDVLEELRPEDTFWDIGANIGVYTCLAASVLAPDRVVAFEPHPTNAELLERNLEVNPFDARVCRTALFDQRGGGSLLASSSLPGEGEHRLARDPTEETIPVELETADALLEQCELPLPSMVKIDVEGAEAAVLRGMHRILSETRMRVVYCEIHPEKLPSFGSTANEVHELLERHGFGINSLGSRNSEHFLKAWRR